jgi:hypothetical protein
LVSDHSAADTSCLLIMHYCLIRLVMSNHKTLLINDVGTLQTGHPCAQDLKQVPRRQTLHPAREAPASPCVSWHRTHLPAREGSGIVMCPTVLDPPTSPGGLWRHHVPHDSACYGPQAKGKYSAGLLTRPGPPASEACPRIPKAHDIRLIMTSPGTRSR